MSVFQCKMCGGALNVTEGMVICECEYCNTKQTVSHIKDVQQKNMINRANHFRQNGEFDKALEIYERIMDTCSDDPDIYWSIVLCNYGISYVDDPGTNNKIATCNRTKYESVLNNSDYHNVLRYASEEQAEYYKQQAEYIDSIQKGILEISSKEKPYDVFICYKETDENGERTQDSVIAQDIYERLEKEGFRVFFARITLEGKLGKAYEPYIFSALATSKAMLVVGTKPEYMNSAWVKNEWSRYISMMRNDDSKSIVPVYRDMNPHDMPDELSFLQSLDMSKIGAIQDLIHGIRKLTGKKNSQISSRSHSSHLSNVNDLVRMLDRINILLDDGSFVKALEQCEKVLDIDTYNGEAFLYKLFAETQVRNWSELEKCTVAFDKFTSYKLACKYNEPDVSERLQKICKQVHFDLIYADLSKDCYSATIEESIEYLDNFDNDKEADKLKELCHEKLAALDKEIEAARKLSDSKKIDNLKKAVKIYEKVGDYKDSSSQMISCMQEIARIEGKNSKKSNRKHKAARIFSCIMTIIMCLFIPLFSMEVLKYVANGRIKADGLITIILLNTVWSYLRSRGFDRCSCFMRAYQIYVIIASVALNSILLFTQGHPFFGGSEIVVFIPIAVTLVLMLIAEIIGRKIYEKHKYQ